MFLTLIASVAFLAWLYLLLFHGRFWRADQRVESAAELPEPEIWPSVVTVTPARDEAGFVGRALASLDAQDYPGALSMILSDDHSGDGTAAEARDAVKRRELTIITARELPPGWSGKMWAVSEGLVAIEQERPPDYVLLTDADIAHSPDSLRLLIMRAEAEARDAVSVMAKLDIGSMWDRLLIPAFVFFFQKLYPFPLVNDPDHRIGAAAGGCLLIRYSALQDIGGVAAIRDALIDDVALAQTIQRRRGGPHRLWLGLGETVRSIRPYLGFAGVWRMVSRTAFTQLDHAAVKLIGTVIGMMLLYLAAPFLALAVALHGNPLAALIGAITWLMMAFSFLPTLRLYRQPWALGLLLPLAGALYTAMTVDSAQRYWRGRGGAWKGRYQAPRGNPGQGGTIR